MPFPISLMKRLLRSHFAETVAGLSGGLVSGYLPSQQTFTRGWGYYWVCCGEPWLSLAVVRGVVTCLVSDRLSVVGGRCWVCCGEPWLS